MACVAPQAAVQKFTTLGQKLHPVAQHKPVSSAGTRGTTGCRVCAAPAGLACTDCLSTRYWCVNGSELICLEHQLQLNRHTKPQATVFCATQVAASHMERIAANMALILD